jgi:hypothetical protein
MFENFLLTENEEWAGGPTKVLYFYHDGSDSKIKESWTSWKYLKNTGEKAASIIKNRIEGAKKVAGYKGLPVIEKLQKGLVIEGFYNTHHSGPCLERILDGDGNPISFWIDGTCVYGWFAPWFYTSDLQKSTKKSVNWENSEELNLLINTNGIKDGSTLKEALEKLYDFNRVDDGVVKIWKKDN